MSKAKKKSSKSKPKAVTKAPRELGFQSYFDMSRDLGTSIVLVIPLFILYQIGVLTTGGVRNGVDFMSDVMWLLSDGNLLTYLGINGGLLVAFIVAVFALRKRGEFNPKIFPFVVGESTLYALLLGGTVVQLMSSLGMGALLASGSGGDYGLVTSVVLSLGAGLYEETVFRLGLMGGLFALATRVIDLPKWLAAIFALILSSLIFSAIHYVGPLADTFALGSFMFRFFAGVILAGIFYLRGFAVAVYTHAIYDIIVMVFH